MLDNATDYGLGDNGMIARTEVKDGGGWVTWDVTRVIQEWITSKYPNYGWLIQGGCEEDCGLNFCTSEYKNKKLRPVLEIQYD